MGVLNFLILLMAASAIFSVTSLLVWNGKYLRTFASVLLICSFLVFLTPTSPFLTRAFTDVEFVGMPGLFLWMIGAVGGIAGLGLLFTSRRKA